MVPTDRDRIDEWWNHRSIEGFTRQALVRMRRKESSKDEALERRQSFVRISILCAPFAASKASDERPGKNRRAALDPAPGASQRCCL